jgi:hypothetical protein
MIVSLPTVFVKLLHLNEEVSLLLYIFHSVSSFLHGVDPNDEEIPK